MKFDDAFEIVMNSARPPGTERLSIKDNDLLNRILAEDVTSDIDMPPFNKSLRDGFACRRAECRRSLGRIRPRQRKRLLLYRAEVEYLPGSSCRIHRRTSIIVSFILALNWLCFLASASPYIAIYSFQKRGCANSCRYKLGLFFQIVPFQICFRLCHPAPIRLISDFRPKPGKLALFSRRPKS
jgi:hypothetical protein